MALHLVNAGGWIGEEKQVLLLYLRESDPGLVTKHRVVRSQPVLSFSQT